MHSGAPVTFEASKRSRRSNKELLSVATNDVARRPREIIAIYERHWSIEVLFKEILSCSSICLSRSGFSDDIFPALSIVSSGVMLCIRANERSKHPVGLLGQIGERTDLYNTTLGQHDNLIGVSNRRKAMSDDYDRDLTVESS